MGIIVDERYHPDLAEAMRWLVEYFQPDHIYQFGSRVRGDAREDSDYDILVVVPETSERYLDRMRIGSRLVRDLELSIQILVLTSSEFDRDQSVVASLPARVSREGQILYAA